jgi:rubredoxin
MRELTQADIDEYYEDEPEKLYCPDCEKRGYLVLLGPRILMPNEPRPDDYEDWYECPKCYFVHHYVEIPAKEEIKNAIELQDSPYEDKTKLASAHKRRTKKKVVRHINKHIRKTNDPDIQREIQQHGSDNVRVIFDSNP